MDSQLARMKLPIPCSLWKEENNAESNLERTKEMAYTLEAFREGDSVKVRKRTSTVPCYLLTIIVLFLLMIVMQWLDCFGAAGVHVGGKWLSKRNSSQLSLIDPRIPTSADFTPFHNPTYLELKEFE